MKNKYILSTPKTVATLSMITQVRMNHVFISQESMKMALGRKFELSRALKRK